MYLQILCFIVIIVVIVIIMYFTNSLVYLEGFGSKIINLNINNSQTGSGGCNTNFVTPWYGAWTSYRPYYSQYPYYPRYPYFY